MVACFDEPRENYDQNMQLSSFYGAVKQYLAHGLAVRLITLLFWFPFPALIALFLSLKTHHRLPVQHQTIDKHSYRLAGEHTGALGY